MGVSNVLVVVTCIAFISEDILQVRIAQLEAQVATIPSSSMELHPPQAAAEVRRLRKERNDLKDAISNFETELLQIQMDTKTLADDRDNFKLLYEQVCKWDKLCPWPSAFFQYISLCQLLSACSVLVAMVVLRMCIGYVHDRLVKNCHGLRN